MSSAADAIILDRVQALWNEARRRLGGAVSALESVRPRYVLAVLIVVQWAAVLALALTVRHAGWIFYQGGDQLWYYTVGWQLAHGHLGIAGIGYLWPVLLAPISLATGPNVANAYPAIILIDVLLLLPIGLLALYGIAERIAGRLFGYWATALWIALPFLGITYANAGYHQRFTELFLPQALGLTAMADLPTLVAALVSGYFTARILFDEQPQSLDAIAAGVAAGAAIGIKPATTLFLAGPALALLAARRSKHAALFAVGLAPALLAMTVFKWRGLGALPIASPYESTRLAAGSLGLPLGFLNLGHYVNLDWGHFQENLAAVQEYFWSGRLVEWVPFAGAVALARRSFGAMLLVVGWFAAFIVVKGTFVAASLSDASLPRILLPAYPMFVLLVAALPMLWPGVPRRLAARPATENRRAGARRRTLLVVAGIVGTAVLPLAAFAAVPLEKGTGIATFGVTPIPGNVNIGVRATTGSDGAVTLTWNDQRESGGPVFYVVYRAPMSRPDYSCVLTPSSRCTVALDNVGSTKTPRFVDRPGPGRWHYRIGVAANWLDSPNYGDVYVMSSHVAVTVPNG